MHNFDTSTFDQPAAYFSLSFDVAAGHVAEVKAKLDEAFASPFFQFIIPGFENFKILTDGNKIHFGYAMPSKLASQLEPGMICTFDSIQNELKVD